MDTRYQIHSTIASTRSYGVIPLRKRFEQRSAKGIRLSNRFMSAGSPGQTKLGPGNCELSLIVSEKMIIYHAMEPLAEEKIISYLKENITPLNRSS